MSRYLIAFALVSSVLAGEGGWTLPDPMLPPAGGGPEQSWPASFPEHAGLERRRALVIERLAGEDLGRWRRGYFTGGDPGKYLPGAAMARLLTDPADAMVPTYMNDNRSFKEQYHFACLNWSRFLPMFGSVLTAETRSKFSAEAARYSPYLSGGGTENHKIMWFSAALVLPWYIEGERFAQRSRTDALADRKAWLKGYVRELYRHGMGEWDSSTYNAFCIHGMLNVYDFSQDEEVRAWARAALDWYVSWYALKYLDGVQAGPSQRGSSPRVASSLTDQTGWLWWGSRADEATIAKDFRYAMHAALSGWRPNAVLSRLAAKTDLPFPIEQRNTKPNYWFGQGIEPRPAAWAETLWYAQGVGIGSLWRGHGGQATRFTAVASTAEGAVVVFGGTPIGRNDGDGSLQRYKYADGNGRYDQTAMVGGTHVCLSVLPEDEPLAYAFITIPDGVQPQRVGDWWLLSLDGAWLGVRGVTHAGEVGVSDLTERQVAENARRAEAGQDPRHLPQPLLRFPGQRTGFIATILPKGLAADAPAAAAVLDGQTFAIDAAALQVQFTTRDGRVVQVAHRADANQGAEPAVTIDEQAIDPSQWAVGSGPMVSQTDGILQLWDGERGYQVDVRGDVPVWSDHAP